MGDSSKGSTCQPVTHQRSALQGRYLKAPNDRSQGSNIWAEETCSGGGSYRLERPEFRVFLGGTRLRGELF